MSPDGQIRRSWLLLLLYLQMLLHVVHAFYIPGYSIRSYRDNDNIPLLVNKIYSDHSELQYAYYDLPFVCPPTGLKRPGSSFVSGQHVALNLGEVLRGDRIRNSDFEVNMGEDVTCRSLCSQDITRGQLRGVQDLIEHGYSVEWILDNLPGATSFVTVDRQHKYYSSGFKLGFKEYDPATGWPMYYLHNHFTMVIRWRRAPGKAGDHGRKVVVGFEVYPKSINGQQRRSGTECRLDVTGDDNPFPLYIAHNVSETTTSYRDSSYTPHKFDSNSDSDSDSDSMTIPYTYSIYFREEHEVEWANRWGLYFREQSESTFTHWLAIVNSIIISGSLGAICMVIWIRTTQVDATTRDDGVWEEVRSHETMSKRSKGANNLDTADEKGAGDEELLEDVAGWKLLHADVFRPPSCGGLLAPILGSGMQLVFMLVGLLLLSCLGVLNPSWRGGFISVGFGLFVFAGGVSGYFSACVYNTCGGRDWRQNALVTALLFPGLLFGTLFVLNLFTWAQASSTAIPSTTLLAIVCLWLLIQLPLVYLGSYYGFRTSVTWEQPTRTSSTPRPIPPQTWFNRHRAGVTLLAGLVPFAVLFIELLFVFKSLYLDKSSYYYVFGFLSIIGALLTVTVAETVIITTYLQLCAENYHWWWQSFAVGASSAVWIFVYSSWYFATRLHIAGVVSALLFFSYSAMACAVYGLATGTVGFLTAFVFIRRMYADVKVD